VGDLLTGYLATQSLIDHGHEIIALITKIDDTQGKLRMKGYFDAYEANTIVVRGEHIYTFDIENKIQVIEQIVQHIFERKINISALVCYNDEIAYDIIQRLKGKNIRVPRDISVVGEDNSVLSRLSEMNLTSTSHPQELLGV